MPNNRNIWLLLAAGAVFLAALLHVIALVVGPDMIAALGAPPNITESSRQGTMLAPIALLAIAALLAIFGLYAISAAGYIRKLPLIRSVLALVAIVLLLRGLILPVLLLAVPQIASSTSTSAFAFEVFTAALCFAIGLAFALGLRQAWPQLCAAAA